MNTFIDEWYWHNEYRHSNKNTTYIKYKIHTSRNKYHRTSSPFLSFYALFYVNLNKIISLEWTNLEKAEYYKNVTIDLTFLYKTPKKFY